MQIGVQRRSVYAFTHLLQVRSLVMKYVFAPFLPNVSHTIAQRAQCSSLTCFDRICSVPTVVSCVVKPKVSSHTFLVLSHSAAMCMVISTSPQNAQVGSTCMPKARRLFRTTRAFKSNFHMNERIFGKVFIVQTRC